MLSPIQTRRHWLQKTSFEAGADKNDEIDCEVSISMRHAKKDDYWHVGLRVQFGGKEDAEANYQGAIEYEGIFDIHPDFPADKTDELVRMNGGAILYGAIREHVLGLTARSAHGPFELPTIDARMFLGSQKKAAAEKPLK